MSRGDDRLRRLARIADLKRDAETLALSAINAEIARLQQQVARMRRSVGTRARDLELDPSRMSGADVLWTRRTEQQVARVQVQLARLHVEREAAITAARAAFGKAHAVKALVERNDAAANARRARSLSLD